MCKCIYCVKNPLFAELMNELQAKDHEYALSTAEHRGSISRAIVRIIREAIEAADSSNQLGILESHRLAILEDLPSSIRARKDALNKKDDYLVRW
ncbi:MAG: hypothetical protein Q7S34_04035 [bacterium]|nr:hypothetical protein [bacterium]